MATATEIATRALKRIGKTDSYTSPDSADVSDATEELNALIASFEAEGLSGDVLPLDSRFENAVVDMLVVRIAPLFGVPVDDLMRRNYDAGWTQMQAAFTPVPASRFENALRYTGHYTDIGYIIGDPTELIANWEASTAYVVRQCVVNSGNVYECVTAGTSDTSGGPTTTAAEITDGTVIWCWRRVDGG